MGLTIGTVVVILLSLYVKDEWTFDQFHEKSDRIYRAWVKEHVQDEIFFNTVTPYILGSELRDNFPEIDQVVRYATINSQIKKGNFTEQENIHVVEPSFFKVFDFELLRGLEGEAMEALHSVIVTEEMGQKYFGDPYPMGQTMTMQLGGEWVDFTVSGVIEDAPSNSSIQYDLIIPFKNTENLFSERGRQSWTNVFVETYALLNTENNVADLEAKIAPFVDEKVSRMYEPGEYIVGLQPLTDIHLNGEYPVGLVSVSNSQYPYILAGVALLILILACINFTTLAVGRSVTRAKEVGVRKTSGATRGQLMMQFWSEAMVTAGIAVGLGLLLAHLFLPYFNTLADKQLTIDFSLSNMLILLSLVFVVGLLSGLYPSLVLSNFSPIRSLRGAISKIGNDRHVVLRGLVSFQFVLSILLIICTMVMTQQMRFLQNKNLGFSQDQIIVLPYSRSGARLSQQMEEGKNILNRLRSELNGKQDFKAFAYSTHTFGTPGWVNLGYTDDATQQYRNFMVNEIDEQFLPLHEIDIIEGRNFSSETAADSQAVIVNKAYVDAFGVQVGQAMQEPFNDFRVVGITDDFNFESLHSDIRPLVLPFSMLKLRRQASDMNASDAPTPKLSIKVNSDNLQATLSTLRMAWKEVAQEQPFNFSFLDNNLDRLYRSESRLSQLIGLATGLAIFIACLGLFGVATLMIAQRRKEIGIRKVLGASVADIVLMLNKNLSIQVIVATVVAIPLAYYFMQNWLSDFAYRVSISPWVFLLAGIAALVLAWVAVSFQSLKAAISNPVKSLRSE